MLFKKIMTQEEKAKAYDEALKRAELSRQQLLNIGEEATEIEYIFPELKESEEELMWLTRFIEEEAYSLSIDIRDNEDRIKLKKLQKSLAWLEKQALKPMWTEEDERFLDKFDTLCRTEQIYFSKDSVVNEILYKMRYWLKSIKKRMEEQR